jgi:hypothetical protein
MASSSSANKVARVAARSAGGKGSKNQANWLFPAAIAAILVIGIGVVAFARDKNAGNNDNTTPPRANLQNGQPSDHWHNAFAVNICGRELPAIAQPGTDPLGIHTHGDGLIHIHPFSVSAAGKRDTMAKYWDLIGLKVTDDGFKNTDGKVYKEGSTTCGGKPAELVMAHWKDALTAEGRKPDNIIRSGFSKVHYSEDKGAYTRAFVAKGTTDIPAPSSSKEVAAPSDVTGGG